MNDIGQTKKTDSEVLEKTDGIIAYKITDKGGVCNPGGDNPKKYQIGKTYRHRGNILICKSGIHASRNPIDCMCYHNLYQSRFFKVLCYGEIVEQKDKICCSRMDVLSELSLKNFIDLAYTKTFENCNSSTQAASGNFSTQETQAEHCISAAIGYGSRVKASCKTSWIVIADISSDGTVRRVVAKKPGQKVDGIKIRINTWYWFDGGKLMSERRSCSTGWRSIWRE